MNLGLWRLITSGLRSDGRWLAPVVLSVAFALAALVPVQALADIGETGVAAYARRVLGADIRVVLDESRPVEPAEAERLLAAVQGQGAAVVSAHELTMAVTRPEAVVHLRVFALSGSGYPFYGGELWSHPPESALAQGVALSTNAMAALAVSIGDTIELGGRPVTVTATFPESLLTMATFGIEGFAMVSGQHLWGDGVALPDLPGRVLMVRLPADIGAAGAVTGMLTVMLGPHGLHFYHDLMPVVGVGVNLLKHTLFWAALLVIFICAFGVAFGVEDYLNSKSDEIATLKMVGLSTGKVTFIILLRLILAGMVAALLAVGLGSALTAATLAFAGTRAAGIAQLVRLPRFPWELAPIGIALLLAFGGVPLWLRLREKPHRVLWSKLRGAPLTSRTGAGVGSLLATLVISVPVMLGLARWYLGRGQAQATVFAAMVAGVLLILGLTYACMRAIAALRPFFPAAWSWPLTYLRAGAARTVAATTAVALALAIGSGAALVDRVVDRELQAAIFRQVPLTVFAVAPYGTLDPAAEAEMSVAVSGLSGVKATVWGDLGLAYIETRGVLRSRHPGGVQAVLPEQAGLWGSPLADYLHLAQPGSQPLTIRVEVVRDYDPPEEILGTRHLLVGAAHGAGPPVGERVPVTVVALEPRRGLRFGLAAVTVPRGTLPLPLWQVLGVRTDPAYTAAVAGYLEQQQTFPEVHDMGPIVGLLRKAADELSFIWWATATIALMVSIVILLTTTSVARIARTYDLAMLRVIGFSGWRLAVGPYVESLAQGLIAGLVGSLAGTLAVYRGLPLVVAVELPVYKVIPSITIVASVGISMLLGITAHRSHLRRPPLEVLRSE